MMKKPAYGFLMFHTTLLLIVINVSQFLVVGTKNRPKVLLIYKNTSLFNVY